jgi:hypothetical protein
MLFEGRQEIGLQTKQLEILLNKEMGSKITKISVRFCSQDFGVKPKTDSDFDLAWFDLLRLFDEN